MHALSEKCLLAKHIILADNRLSYNLSTKNKEFGGKVFGRHNLGQIDVT